jgi:uroporphyrinogen III methyltransferase/synthase
LGAIGEQPLAAPSVIVVGEVAAVDLSWFAQRPLLGRRILVTRTRVQASQLVETLRGAGAETIVVPVIQTAAPEDGGEALRRAAQSLGQYDWVVLTSPNGAERLLAAVADTGGDARSFSLTSVAAIGPSTAEVLARGGIVADLVPDRFVAEGLLESFPEIGPEGGRVLLARAAVARDVLPDGLRELGWEVDVVDAYCTLPATVTDAQRARAAEAEVVTFTSSSTVDNFIAAFGMEALPPVVACIGPITAATARAHGLTVDIEAEAHTIDGLVDALAAWAARQPSE